MILVDRTVVIRGEHIEEVTTAPVPGVSKRINGRGKYLIPGLWDMHVHLGGIDKNWFPLYLANGVVGLREMACNQDAFTRIKKYRTELAARSMIGPEIVATADAIEAVKPGKPAPFGVFDAAGARTAVDQLREIGTDFVKVGGDVPRAAYFGLAAECRRLNFPFVGHVPHEVGALEAADAGQRSIEHMDGLLPACSSDESVLREMIARKQILRMEAILDTYNEANARELAARLRKNGTWICPTLVEQRFGATDPDFERDPRRKYVGPGYVQDWEKQLRAPHDRELARRRFQKNSVLLGLLWRHGVRVLAGTEAPFPYCVPGFALHDEMALLVRAGLTPAAALGAATCGPAEFLGRADGIQPGNIASLVLLDANPLSDVGNTEKIAAVIVRGHVFSRRDLDRMLKGVAAAVARRE